MTVEIDYIIKLMLIIEHGLLGHKVYIQLTNIVCRLYKTMRKMEAIRLAMYKETFTI